MEYRATIWYCLNNKRHSVKSGWWDDQKKAEAEANHFMEQQAPAGLYIIEIGIQERRAA